MNRQIAVCTVCVAGFAAAASLVSTANAAEKSSTQSPATSSDKSSALEGGLPVITVTATRRAESLQKVPISVVAFSASDLQDMRVSRADDVTRLAPNISSRSTAGDTNVNYYIRGVGDTNFHLNTVGAVGIYMDEVSYSSSASSSFSLFDMERVEVLRGPQNTLYGRNTTGGAINYISKKPVIGGGTTGYVQTNIGRFDQIDGEGAIGTEVGDHAAIRLSTSVNTRDGIQHNFLLGRDMYRTERYAGRLQLLVKPTDSLSFLANAHGGVNRGDSPAYKAIGLLDPAKPTNPGATTAATFLNPCSVPLSQLQPQSNCADVVGFVDNGRSWRDVASLTPRLKNDIDSWGGYLKGNWTLPAVTVTSLTSYEHNKLARGQESVPGTVIFDFYQNLKAKQVSQEIRLTSPADQRLRWIAGALYLSENADFSTSVRRRPPSGPDGIAVGPGDVSARTIIPTTIVSQNTKVHSAYGQVDFDLTDKWTVVGGLRWSQEDKTGHNFAFVGEGSVVPPLVQITGAIAETQINFVAADEDFGHTWQNWGGKVGLNYKATADLLLYGNVSRGFKSGGFSLAAQQAIISAAANRAVAPETLTAYELGFKSTLLGNTLRLNGAVFYYDWLDQQTFTLVHQGATDTPLLVNIPKTSLYGGELESQWRFAKSWLLNGGIGYLHSRVDDATNLPMIAVGNQLINSPKISFNAALRKEWSLQGGELSAQVDGRYVDAVFYSVENDPVTREPGYWEFGAHTALAFGPDQRYWISAWVQNLTGTKYCLDRQSLRGVGEIYQCLPNPGVPLYGVTLRASF